MNTKTKNLLSKIVYIIVLAFLVASCQPTAPAQNGSSNDIQDIRVQATEPTKSTSKVEQFPLPNCGGSDKLAQSLGTFASASKSATVGTKAAVTGGGEVAVPETAKLKLEIQVEQAYQQKFESANSRLDTIIMSAAAGTHVVYTIVWEEQTFDSIVQYSSDGKVYEVPYTYVLSVPKIDKSYNVICDGSNTGNNGSENTTATQPVTGNSASGNCQETSGQSLSSLPSAPSAGCVLIVEWWYPPDANNCGILITSGNPNLPNNPTGTWWNVYPTRPESHIQEFQQKSPQCKVDDQR